MGALQTVVVLQLDLTWIVGVAVGRRKLLFRLLQGGHMQAAILRTAAVHFSSGPAVLARRTYSTAGGSMFRSAAKDSRHVSFSGHVVKLSKASHYSLFLRKWLRVLPLP